RVVRVVAAGPLRIFHGGDLVPEGDGVRALGALGGVGVDVVPAAVLQRDGEDVGDGVVEGLPGGGRLILLGVIRPRADDVVGVVGGVQDDGFHVLWIGAFWVL